MLKKFMVCAIAAGALWMASAEPSRHEGPPDPAKMAERRKEHMDRLHDKLGLAGEQEAAWQKFVDRTQHEPPPPLEDMKSLKAPERMEKMLEHMKERQQKMEGHLQALKEFYAQLSPEQQATFDKEAPPPMPPMGPPGRRHRDKS